MRIGRPEMVHACIHTSERECLSWQWRGTQSQAAEIGWPACLRGEHMHHACQRVEWNDPLARAAVLRSSHRSMCITEPHISVAHGGRPCPRHIGSAHADLQQCTTCGSGAVCAPLCALVHSTSARASTCQFAGRHPSIVPTLLDEGEMDQRVACFDHPSVFSMHGSLI